MANHQATWKKWLETIAPVRPPTYQDTFNGVTLDVCSKCSGNLPVACECFLPDLDALAEALSMAAPWGPANFVCEDADCDGKNCVSKRKYKLETRVKNLEAVVKMMLDSCDPHEYSSGDQQAARRTARYFLENEE